MGSGISLIAVTVEGSGIEIENGAGMLGLQNEAIIATAVAPSSRAQEVAQTLLQSHTGIETHVLPLPSVDMISTLLRRDLDSVRNALITPAGTQDSALREAMNALPRARRLAALLESLVPLLTASATMENSRTTGLKKAPKAAVEQLPTRCYKVEPGVTRECYICLEAYAHGDELRKLPCAHEFHAKCVDRWLLDVHRTCPCCRADVCLDSDSDVEDEDATRAAVLPTATPYDQLRASSSSNTLYNRGLSSEQAAEQMEYMSSRASLSNSISQLQLLRERQASLVRERTRLEEIQTGLRQRRRVLRSELDSLREAVGGQNERSRATHTTHTNRLRPFPRSLHTRTSPSPSSDSDESEDEVSLNIACSTGTNISNFRY